jgi:hypothetical protein
MIKIQLGKYSLGANRLTEGMETARGIDPLYWKFPIFFQCRFHESLLCLFVAGEKPLHEALHH